MDTLLLLIPALLFQAPEPAPAEEKPAPKKAQQEDFIKTQISVKAQRSENGKVFTVKARFAPLSEVLNAIQVEESKISWANLDPNIGKSMININLENRGLEEILHLILGSFNLTFKKIGEAYEVQSVPTADTVTGRDWLIDDGKSSAIAAMVSFPGAPEAPILNLLIGRLYDESGELESANRVYSETVVLFPNKPEVPEALFRLGKNNITLGNWKLARGFLDRLASDYPDYENLAQAYFYLARSDIQLENNQLAESELETLLKEFPESKKDLQPQIYLAEVERRLNNPKKALEILDPLEYQAMTLNETRPDFMLIHGMVLLDNQQYEKAAARLFRFYGEHGDRVEANEALYHAAFAAYKAGRYLDALLMAETCREKSGVKPNIDFAKWSKLYGKIREALHLVNPLRGPLRGEDVMTTARIHYSEGAVAASIESLEKIFDDPKLGFLARVDAAEQYLEIKKPEEAIQILKASIPHMVKDTLINRAFRILGDAYIKTGENSMAEDAYKGILGRKP